MKIDPTYGQRIASIAGAQLERLAPGGDGMRLDGVPAGPAAATAQAEEGGRGAFQITLGAAVVRREVPKLRSKANEAAAAAASSGGAATVTLDVTKGKKVVARRDEPIDVLPGTAAYVELPVSQNVRPTTERR